MYLKKLEQTTVDMRSVKELIVCSVRGCMINAVVSIKFPREDKVFFCKHHAYKLFTNLKDSKDIKKSEQKELMNVR